MNEKLSSKMEDYLEMIYFLTQENGVARVGEIATRLQVKSPTVNSAIKILSEQGYVQHQKYGYIRLTKDGERLAIDVKNKHEIIYRFLTEFLLLDSEAAEKEACCIEHSISKETFQRLSKFFAFMEEGLDGERPKILKKFEEYLKTGKRLKCK